DFAPAFARLPRGKREKAQRRLQACTNALRYLDAIRDSRIAASANKLVSARWARMAFSIAVRAKPRGAARSCSHSCSVRFEICNFNAASLCERLFRSRQARSLRGNAPGANL